MAVYVADLLAYESEKIWMAEQVPRSSRAKKLPGNAWTVANLFGIQQVYVSKGRLTIVSMRYVDDSIVNLYLGKLR